MKLPPNIGSEVKSEKKTPQVALHVRDPLRTEDGVWGGPGLPLTTVRKGPQKCPQRQVAASNSAKQLEEREQGQILSCCVSWHKRLFLRFAKEPPVSCGPWGYGSPSSNPQADSVASRLNTD